MKTFLCLVLVIFSFVSYIGITPRLGIYMYHPIPHYIGMLIGIGLLVRLMQKEFTKRRLAATLFSVFVVCFFFWYTTIFSDIDNAKANIATGDVASQSLKQIELVKIDGKRLPLGELFKKKKGTVVVFTRGAW
jgi:glycopeptide antibiotics resistance protein